MVRFEQSGKSEKAAASQLASSLGLHPVVAAILAQRGLTTPEQASAFLRRDEMHDPFLLDGMLEAVERIRQAIARQELICVYGDYDVDGICATALLLTSLGDNGAKLTHYFPSRAAGYGVHKAALDELHTQCVRLLITADCGITAIDEITYAQTLGMDTIVTDHHECLESLPDGIVINPKRSGGSYPFAGLCGTGVAAKLVHALFGTDTLAKHWDIVAFATVADIVPLRGENRSMVALGLKHINEGNACIGLKALVQVASIDPQTLNERQISFALAPRLNAAGRMGDAELGLKLLLATDEVQACSMACMLDEANRQRQALESGILAEACSMALESDLVGQRALVLHGENWHSGVIGIVASRLMEKFAKPVVLLSREGDDYVGSCRSVNGVHMFEAVRHCADLLVRYGGHEQAAGLTVKAQNLNAFTQRFQAYLRRNYPADAFMPRMRYDLDVTSREVTLPLAKALQALAPFGMGNPMPVFRLSGVEMLKPRTMGAQHTHLRGSLGQGKRELPFVAFSAGERLCELGDANTWDVLCSADVNVWNGSDTLRLQLRSWQPAAADIRELMRRRMDRFLYGAVFEPESGERQALAHPLPRALPKEQMIQTVAAWLKEDIQGAVLIASTPEAYKTLEPLKAEALDVCWGTLERAHPCAYHTLLLAPLGMAQDWGKFTRIAVLDSCLSRQRAQALAASAGARELLLPAEDGGVENFVQNIALTRGDMAAYYRAMAAWCPHPRCFAGEEAFVQSAMEAMPQAMRPHARLALRVMRELSLLTLETRDGCVAHVPAQPQKRELAQSPTFIRAQNAFSDYQAWVHLA